MTHPLSLCVMKKKKTIALLCFERRISTVSRYYNLLFVCQFYKILKVQLYVYKSLIT